MSKSIKKEFPAVRVIVAILAVFCGGIAFSEPNQAPDSTDVRRRIMEPDKIWTEYDRIRKEIPPNDMRRTSQLSLPHDLAESQRKIILPHEIWRQYDELKDKTTYAGWEKEEERLITAIEKAESERKRIEEERKQAEAKKAAEDEAWERRKAEMRENREKVMEKLEQERKEAEDKRRLEEEQERKEAEDKRRLEEEQQQRIANERHQTVEGKRQVSETEAIIVAILAIITVALVVAGTLAIFILLGILIKRTLDKLLRGLLGDRWS